MHIKQFIQYLRFQKRYSQHTIIAYTKDIDQFSSFLASEYDISDVREANHAIIRSWIIKLANESITSRTINRKLSTLKSLYKFLLSEGSINNNPASLIKAPKVSKKLPVYVE